MSYIGRVATAVQGMAKGMKITLRHYLRFSEVVTQQYPENRATLKLPPRFRGKVYLLRDPEKGTWRCTACGLCVKACPNNSLTVKREKDPETNKFKLAGYYYHFERCTLCGLCVDTCKFSALGMGNEYENAAYERRVLTLRLDTPDGVPQPAPEAP
jgi:NADH-quinone oxidoreductase subunit I